MNTQEAATPNPSTGPQDNPEIATLIALYAECNEYDRRIVQAVLTALRYPTFAAWLHVGAYITQKTNELDLATK